MRLLLTDGGEIGGNKSHLCSLSSFPPFCNRGILAVNLRQGFFLIFPLEQKNIRTYILPGEKYKRRAEKEGVLEDVGLCIGYTYYLWRYVTLFILLNRR